MNNASEVISAALHKMFRPLVKILLNHGYSVQELMQVVRRVYVEVAEKEFQLLGKKQSTSRISVLTGLNRTEVARLRDLLAEKTEETENVFHHRAARVISGWARDSRYHHEGRPADLPIEGENGCFSELIRSYSGGMTVQAVLDELIRVGNCEKMSDGKIRLCHDVYVPHQCNLEKIRFMGDATSDLLHSIAHNINNPLVDSRLQLSVAYDNLPQNAAKEFHNLSKEEAIDLMKQWDKWLSQYDRDVNPSVRGEGSVRAGVGVYFFEYQQDWESDRISQRTPSPEGSSHRCTGSAR